MANGKECSGEEIHVGDFKTTQECADRCARASTMFAFGINKCKKKYWLMGHEVCPCYCETVSSFRGECTIVTNSGYNLYRFNVKGRYYVFLVFFNNLKIERAFLVKFASLILE